MADITGFAFQPRFTPQEIEERRARRQREEEERAAAMAAAAGAVDVDVGLDDEAEGDPDDDPEDRMNNTAWCSCERCRIPDNPSVVMCVCCQEQREQYPGLSEKLDGPAHITPCITEHTDFVAVCLTNAVLEMLAAHTREQRGYPINEEWTNRLYRLLSYQSYTYWIHHRLGRKNRRVIPACAVTKIRGKWPEEDPNMYVSYKHANEDEIQDAWNL